MKAKFFTLLWVITFTTDLFAQTIRITNGEWEPYLSQYSYQYGFNSHVVTEAFKLEGIDVEWDFFPWMRAYKNAENGSKWEASCCWWANGKTEEAFLLSEAVSKTSFVFFHLKSYKFEWNSIQDLKGIKIGVTLQYDYGREFMDAIDAKTLDVELVTKDEFNYKKLLAGRIKIFPNDPFVGASQIRNYLSADESKLLTHSTKEFNISTLHLILSKNNKRSKYFLDKFNAGIIKLKKSGRYQQMLNDFNIGKYDKKKSIWKEK